MDCAVQINDNKKVQNFIINEWAPRHKFMRLLRDVDKIITENKVVDPTLTNRYRIYYVDDGDNYKFVKLKPINGNLYSKDDNTKLVEDICAELNVSPSIMWDKSSKKEDGSE